MPLFSFRPGVLRHSTEGSLEFRDQLRVLVNVSRCDVLNT